MDTNASNLNTVTSRTAALIIEFARVRLASNPKFHVEELRQFITGRTHVAPASPDRVLRLLRKQSFLNYEVVNRAKSLYRILSINAPLSTISQVVSDDLQRGRKLIQDLTAFVNEDTLASKYVWDIVTGLRGPDSSDFTLKDNTTVPLRYAAGFRQKSRNTIAGFVCQEGPLPTETKDGTHHFNTHYNKAVHGLKSLKIK